MRVALVAPPIPIVTTSLTPSSGLAYLAAILLQKGADVSIVSSNAEKLDTRATIERIIAESPELVGVSVTTPTVNNTFTIINAVKKALPGVTIIVGGPHPTLFPEGFLEQGADYVIRGEGEITLGELYDLLKNGKSARDIPGISTISDGKIVNNPPRQFVDDLDCLPFPAWELFPLSKFSSDFRIKKFSLPILTSRGCPSHCVFCYKGIFGDRFRVRRPEEIIKEIKYFKDKFAIEEFAIVDDSFTSDPARAIEVCNLIVSHKIDLPWSLPAGIRVSTVTADLVKSLKKAGCYRAALGIESGNQSILNSIKKGITLEQVRKAVGLLRGTGITSVGYFMMGNLEDTLQTIDETIEFALGLGLDYAQFTKAMPYPGTAMYTILKNEKRITADNWDDFDYFLKSRPVFTHRNLTSAQIDQKLKEAYRKFYCRPGHILKHITSIRSPRELRNFLKNSVAFFKIYS